MFLFIVASMGAQFSMTKDDMLGNIKKIEEKYVTNKEKYRKLKDVLQDEKDNNVDKKDKSATVGGLWLKRFVYLYAQNDNDFLGPSIKCRTSLHIYDALPDCVLLAFQFYYYFI
ncbi:pleckstrin homology domain-containing family A member 8-like [Ruditapes philippinarum]|uniref:pleckstrin homology domain-containing family A member 8-like n=1 Tax=Ruditapes philippinarum TaxID=129788 RepID=UPI00295AE465|nr:pleckstrin homology domain-containing family A member 8-like [Ruditapes philippinarum]